MYIVSMTLTILKKQQLNLNDDGFYMKQLYIFDLTSFPTPTRININIRILIIKTPIQT